MTDWALIIVRGIYSSLLLATATHWLLTILRREPFLKGQRLLYVFLYLSFAYLVGVLVGRLIQGGTLIGVVALFFTPAVCYKQRDLRMVFYGITVIAMLSLSDIGTTYTLTFMLGAEGFNRIINEPTLWGGIMTNALGFAFNMGFVGIVKLSRDLHGKTTRQMPYFLLVIRPILLLLITQGIYFTTITQYALQAAQYSVLETTYMYILYIVLLPMSLTYLVQDFTYIRQRRRNETLEQHQRINEALLANMRAFKHNIANMLYGLEGEILSGDAAEIRAYYDQLVAKLTLIHNENIIMLRNLPVSPVTALLLRQIECAQHSMVPIYLFVQKNLVLRGLRQADLCSVLGVLMDNAREAAMQSEVPYVSIELRNAQTTTEIVVRNTYPGDGEPPSLQGSTKPGHPGLGLSSVRDILGRYPRCYLNLHTVGQYVEAQILME